LNFFFKFLFLGLDLITLMSEERMSKFLEDYCYDLDEQVLFFEE